MTHLTPEAESCLHWRPVRVEWRGLGELTEVGKGIWSAFTAAGLDEG